MVVSFEFAEAEGVLRVTLSGEITEQVLMDLWSKGRDVVASFPACKSILDLSGITQLDVSTSAITKLARSHAPDLSTRVFVAPKDVLYGTTRMFQVLSENTRKNVHVVRSLTEAYKLLGVGSPEFIPVSTLKLDQP
jgi:ABC-type transporter Mla MlaB component